MTPEKLAELSQRIAKINATAIVLNQRLAKASGNTYTPPQAVRSAAAHGLELRDKWKRGGLSNSEASDQGIGSGVQRAVNLKNGDALSLATVKRMHAFFSRHQKNFAPEKKESDGGPTAGTIAWYLWGGNAGKSWADGIVAQAEKVQKVEGAYVLGDGKPPAQGKSFVQGDGNSYGVQKDDGAIGPTADGVHVPGTKWMEKSDDPRKTPAPQKDRIHGSDKNPEGSAADTRGGIEITPAIEQALQDKVDAHNAKADHKASLGMLKAVYRRGAGAYSTSHRPNVSRGAWAMARVNAFLKLLRTGSPENKAYTQDNDLLPKDHPRRKD